MTVTTYDFVQAAYEKREKVWAMYLAARKAYIASDLEDEALEDLCLDLSDRYTELDILFTTLQEQLEEEMDEE